MDIVTLQAARAAAKRDGNATFGPITRGNRIAFGGDSNTSLNGFGDNWTRYLCTLTGARAIERGRYATGGFTAEQWESTHLPQVLASTGPDRPNRLILMLGTNNTGGSSWSLSVTAATMTRICDALVRGGVLPVICTIPPRDDSATVNGYVQVWNAWLTRFAQARGYLLLDMHRALVDPNSGGFRTGYTIDGVHLSSVGAKAVALALSPRLTEALAPARLRLAATNSDASNVLTNGLFLTSGGKWNGANGNTGTALGWQSSGTVTNVTPSLITDEHTPGQWQRFIGYGNFNSQKLDVPVVAGRRYALAVKYRTAGMKTSGATYTVNGAFYTTASGGSNIATMTGACPSSWSEDLTDLAGGFGVAYAEMVAPAGATVLRLNAGFNNPSTTLQSTLDVAEWTVTDLTAALGDTA